MSATSASVSRIHFTRDVAQSSFAHVIAKRTYRIGKDTIPPAAEQLALVSEVLFYEDGSTRSEPEVYLGASDGTDVVIQGSAFAAHGPVARLEVSAAVQLASRTAEEAEATARRVLVIGDRRAKAHGGAAVAFTDPVVFESMPLTYARAYGGHDAVADRTHPEELTVELSEEAGESTEAYGMNTYPRNRTGRGYVIYPDDEAIERALLPNVERPGDLLTPERMIIGTDQEWPRAPIPAGFDYLGQENFPRSAFMGLCAEHDVAALDFEEVESGYLPGSLTSGTLVEKLGNPHSLRFFRGASPWLQLPEFTGGEVIHLTHMHPTRPRLSIPVPREAPEMFLEVFGTSRVELTPKPRRIVIEPDKERMTVVWVGTRPIDRVPSAVYIERSRHAVRWPSPAPGDAP